jgi:hypothetical protein
MTRQQKQYERGNSCSTFYSTYMYKEYDNQNSVREGTAVVVFTQHICIDDRAARTVNERDFVS